MFADFEQKDAGSSVTASGNVDIDNLMELSPSSSETKELQIDPKGDYNNNVY
jgi:hypothetical protein